MSSSPGLLQPNTRFRDRYQVLRVIKSGGMGAVYEVLDHVTAARRALKVMLPSLLDSEELRARFALEARITGIIESDHIVRTSDAGVDDETGTPFIVMELLRGEELGSLLKKRGALPPDDVALYLFQAALALDKTHAANIIHRDLKPDNLFVTIRDDGSPCVKILDFGIAKVIEHHHASTLTRQMLGTPVYMSPEQIRAERNVSPRADIYALGHVAYTLLVGESYWTPESETIPSPYLLAAELLRGPMEAPVARAARRRAAALPSEFDGWFFKATAVKPDDRFERASIAVNALADALGVALPRASRVVLLPDHPLTPPPDPPPGPSPTAPTLPSQPGAPGRFADVPTVTVPEMSARPTPTPASHHPLTSRHTPTSHHPPARPLSAPPPRSASPPLSAPPPPLQLGVETWPRSPSTPSTPPSRTSPSAGQPSRKSDPIGRRERGSQRRFQVRPDAATGILHVKVWGFWDVEEGKAYLDEFRQKASTLLGLGKPWYVLADIADFPPQRPDVSPYVEQTMAYAVENDMRKAANLVNSALSKMQISRLSAAMGLPEYSFFTAEADAIAWLLKG
ncbi:serine/threonine-protein kinase [Sorangium sp. So ce1036]|uniref:serine/threonine protein kinase n=1 Tax=Sorangium sp. So ce1036 TaxID=3133328 RepID=UPI003EFF453C